MTVLARRAILGYLALVAALVGVWAQLAARSFYVDFPGLGHHLVAVDGPYNEHLIRDIGGLNLALLVLTVVAWVRPSPVLVRTAAASWLIYSVPHLAYHAAHLGMNLPDDKVFNIVSLSLSVLLPACLFLPFRPRPPARQVVRAEARAGGKVGR